MSTRSFGSFGGVDFGGRWPRPPLDVTPPGAPPPPPDFDLWLTSISRGGFFLGFGFLPAGLSLACRRSAAVLIAGAVVYEPSASRTAAAFASPTSIIPASACSYADLAPTAAPPPGP